MNMKISGAIAVAVLGAFALTGCVVVEDGPMDRPEASTSQTDRVPEPGQPDASESPEETEPAAQTDESEDTEKSAPRVDIVAESGTTYLRANPSGGLLSPPRVIGPWLTQFVVDGDRFTYREIICTGQAVTEATGKISDGEVVWDDGTDPWIGDADRKTSQVRVSADELTVTSGGTASTDVETGQEAFVGLCKEAGGDVADVFLK